MPWSANYPRLSLKASYVQVDGGVMHEIECVGTHDMVDSSGPPRSIGMVAVFVGKGFTVSSLLIH